ncbi:FeoB-associated Cys-rich membrane protein [Photobacterium aphoticum]|nr:FeoB-associated Cys-rich membrane protein [Photobacterium aphoticum]
MADILVSLCILIIFALAIAKLVVMKRKGGACAGCSQSSGCSSKKNKC